MNSIRRRYGWKQWSVYCTAVLVLLSCSDTSEEGINLELDAAQDSTNTADESSPSETIISGDVPTPDTKQEEDTVEEKEPCPGGFECPCNEPNECDSGYCVPSNDGDMCTKTCIDECPGGYVCKALVGSSDVTYLCMPKLDLLCAPCTEDKECGDLGGLCLKDSKGAGRCGRSCSEESSCPFGYACDSIVSDDGEDWGSQCVPESGQCPCSELLFGITRDCTNENEFGTCVGEEMCTADGWDNCNAAEPVAELCDGMDNNCDGVIDESFLKLGENCDSEEDEDFCANGVWSCSDDGSSVICGDDNPASEQCDGIDNNCNLTVDEGFPDHDDDGQANCVDDDDDNDGDPDATDCEPENAQVYNGAAEICDGTDQNCDGIADDGFPDSDNDGIADCMDPDSDGDGIPDGTDNCPKFTNPDQKNNDGDALGDVCDPDDDNDTVDDEADNCPIITNPDQTDTDEDGDGDLCDPDDDNDGTADKDDCKPKNAAINPNAKEECDGADNNCNGSVDEGFADSDADNLADCIDPDDDNDGSPDDEDCEPTNNKVFPGQIEACNGIDDNCNKETDEDSDDSDDDGVADCIDDDDDDDGVPDILDNCPKVSNPDQSNSDTDLIGNACDSDDDNDGSPDNEDCEPLNPLVKPNGVEVCDGLDNDCNMIKDDGFPDSDDDGIADCLSDDDDADGIKDSLDNCPSTPNPNQKNSDGDMLGDACDTDDDNDGTLDGDDCAPLNSSISPTAIESCDGIDNNCNQQVDEGHADTDQDGIADCIDPDDDNDGINDNQDNCPLVDNPGQFNSDSDLLGNACDKDDDNDADPDITDCEPLNPLIHAKADEICDGVDNNCDGKTDEGEIDTDQDGMPNCIDNDDDNDGIADLSDNCPLTANTGQFNSDSDLLGDACDQDDDNDGDPDTTDCQPLNPAIHKDAVELCDGIDNNCSGEADENFPDLDNDGLANCIDEDDDGDGDPDELDCAPEDPAVNNNAEEICSNGIDDDCNPETACFTVSQNGNITDIQPFPGPKGVVSWYSYGKPKNASANTGLETSNQIVEMLYEDPTDGKIYLVLILDKASDSGGGNTLIQITGAKGAGIILMDDPGEGGNKGTYNPVTGSGTIKWTWSSCCTDGAVIGPLQTPFCVKIKRLSESGIGNVITMNGNKKVQLGSFNNTVEFCANP
ncbi:MAG TPA: hypothetical protein EYN06_05710 [Myxococcales bacterium]|nr:hypothetical protein [Myxococcales bacterium]